MARNRNRPWWWRRLLWLLLLGALLTAGASSSLWICSPSTGVPTTIQKEAGQASLPRARIPNFLLAGVQKAGTTSIAGYLQKQNQVCFGLNSKTNETLKEVLFFGDALDDNTDQCLQQYQAYFRHCQQQTRGKEDLPQIVVDATPNYISRPDLIHQVYRRHGTHNMVKILLVLREPMARELSLYNHMVYQNLMMPDNGSQQWWHIIRVGNNHSGHNTTTAHPTEMRLMTFQEFMDDVVLPTTRITRHRNNLSRYAVWIKQWLTLFERDQIWIANHDELKAHPSQFLQKLHRFLNLTMPTTKSNMLDGHGNDNKLPDTVPSSARPPLPSCAMQQSFALFFEPYNRQLYQLLANHSHGAPPRVETQPFPPFRFRCRNAW